MANFVEAQVDSVEMATVVGHPSFEELMRDGTLALPSQVRPPKPKLKPLPLDLKYAYLGDVETFIVVISTHLEKDQEAKLIHELKQHRSETAWNVADFKGINPHLWTH